MTSETIPAPTIEAPTVSSPSVEDLVKRLMEERGDWLQGELAKLAKKADDRKEKDAAAAQEAALAAKRAEFTNAVKADVADALTALGVTIPQKGFVFNLTVSRNESGETVVDLTDAQKRTRTASASNGTRAPRGSGVGTKSVNNIDGLSGFILPNGSETKVAADVCKALGFEVGKNSAARVLYSESAKNIEKANTVMAVVNGTPQPLGHLIKSLQPAT